VDPAHMLRGQSRLHSPRELLLITDIGPDPDDAKALLVAAMLHKRGRIRLRAVIANGGQQSRERARLAYCFLGHLGLAKEVPVGAGSIGDAYMPQPHEYALEGFRDVADSVLQPGPELLLRTLRTARPRSLRVVCISSLRDIADAIREHLELVLSKVHTIAIQGGLVVDASSPHGWTPDTSVNNEFDRAAAAEVYAFCFSRGVRMIVMSRHAVPMLPMHLARSFAQRTDCPVMTYLANAQSLGLVGLWQRLCSGGLPARCTKRWYFETFCGVSGEAFDRLGYSALDATAPIHELLDGFVKPYDVLAIMTVLPNTEHLFTPELQPGARLPSEGAVNDPKHVLLLKPEQAIDVSHVLDVLRDAYHEVVLITRGAVRAVAGHPPSRTALTAADVEEGRALSRGADPVLVPNPRLQTAKAFSIRHDLTLAPRDVSNFGDRPRETVGACAHMEGAQCRARALTASEIELQVRQSLHSARRHLSNLSRTFVLAGIGITVSGLGLYLLDTSITGRQYGGIGASDLYEVDDTFAARSHVYSLVIEVALCTCMLALPTTNAFIVRVRAVGISTSVFVSFYGAFVYIPWCIQLTSVDPDDYEDPYSLADKERPARVYHNTSLALCVMRLAQNLGIWSSLWWRMARNWHSADGLSTVTWQTLGLYMVVHGLLDSYNVCVALVSGLLWLRAPWLYPVVALASALSVALGVLALHVRLRKWAQASVAQAVASAGPAASIAPLLGYGDRDGEVHPARLCEEALRSFRPVVITPDFLAALDEGELGADDRLTVMSRAKGKKGTTDAPSRKSAIAAAREFGARHAASPVLRLSRKSHGPATVSPEGSRHISSSCSRAFHRQSSSNASDSSTVARGTVSGKSSRPYSEAATRLHIADAYVVHALEDPPGDKHRALAAWATAFQTTMGRPPRVYMDVLCADPSLVPAERLAHLPVYFARSHRLLVLAGPRLVDSLRHATELYLWRALGNRLTDVDVALVPGDAAGRQTVVSALDTFHVMYSAPDPDPGAHEALTRAVQLASVSRFNRVVREYLPLVRTAVARGDAPVSVGVVSPGEEEEQAPPAPGTRRSR